MSTHNSNKYLSRWMNARISFGPKLSPLLASHIFHWWVLASSSLRASGCLQLPASPSLSSLGCSQSLLRLRQGHRLPELVHLLAFHGGTIWGSFSGAQQHCQDPVWCEALRALQEPDKGLNRTLARHRFNYSGGQCRTLPASAAAH